MLKGKRLIGFVLGMVLGCGMVTVLLQSRPKAEGPRILRPWQGKVLFLKDAPKSEEGTWSRVRVIVDPGWKRPIRLEEVLIDSSNHRGSQVIARKAMGGDRVWILVEEQEASKQSAEEWLLKAGVNFIEKPEIGPWLVSLPGEGDVVLEFLEKTQDCSLFKAQPEWLRDPTEE